MASTTINQVGDDPRTFVLALANGVFHFCFEIAVGFEILFDIVVAFHQQILVDRALLEDGHKLDQFAEADLGPSTRTTMRGPA